MGQVTGISAPSSILSRASPHICVIITEMHFSASKSASSSLDAFVFSAESRNAEATLKCLLYFILDPLAFSIRLLPGK